MKKWLVLLLCVALMLPLTACNVPPQNVGYYKIEHKGDASVEYEIYDAEGNVMFSQKTYRPVTISMLGEDIVDICQGEPGQESHTYYDPVNNRLSEAYTRVVAASGRLVAYVYRPDEMSDKDKLVVRDLFDTETFYKEFSLDFSPAVKEAVISASFTVGEAELAVTYYAGRPATAKTRMLPIRSATRYNQVAKSAYEAALACDTRVWTDKTASEPLSFSLMDLQFSSVSLDEAGPLRQAFLDLDGDGVDECIVAGEQGVSLLLYYHEEQVYFEYLYIADYDFYTDGTFSWHDTTSDGPEYGLSRMIFDGYEWQTEELWRVVNDGEPDAAYYVGGKRATKEVFDAAVRESDTTRATFSAFEPSWQKAISRYEAEAIASKHWNIKTGDVNQENGFRYLIAVVSDDNGQYNVYLKWLVEGGHYSTVDRITVNATTGEVSTYSGGK